MPDFATERHLHILLTHGLVLWVSGKVQAFDEFGLLKLEVENPYDAACYDVQYPEDACSQALDLNVSLHRSFVNEHFLRIEVLVTIENLCLELITAAAVRDVAGLNPSSLLDGLSLGKGGEVGDSGLLIK